MGLVPEPWPGADAPGMAAPPGAWPGPESPPRLLLIDRRAPGTRALAGPLQGLLDPAEALRLEKLRRQEDRERFLLGRGLLRLMLGSWLGREPAAVAIGNGPYGKPELMTRSSSGPEGEAPPPRFNVSHSGDLILLGFHPSREVGVDVERLRPVPEWEGIARRCLAAAEREAIRALPERDRGDAFLAAWCRLEAQLKARGLGLFGIEPQRAGSTGEVWPLALPLGYVGAAALA
ncbi:4'-phosphopantetheinyl transferase superfamily protein [Synechococcus sp. CCY 9618]|uniref:4'-phosphopantetheinyl transferase family protein n=1 Tax=Synechococcus sp. CCY 9618 TaxID=2815602 RepID=UPI001C22BC88|nr:4'-phosphopantetheinyl transferase superfamily protein [Synechococcus sp. CCY 9618]